MVTTTFTAKIVVHQPWHATATTPPDSRFLSDVIRRVEPRRIKLSGLGTDQLKITVEGNQEVGHLTNCFLRYFPWAPVIDPFNGQASE